MRETPLRTVLLTDAELDTTIGLLILREGSSFDVYGTATVLEALAKAFPVQRVLQSYAHARWSVVAPGQCIDLEQGRLRVSAFRLGARSPRYVSGRHAGGDWVVGYRLVDARTGGSAVFAPGVERWSVELEAALDGADCAFIDGTFWSDDELAVRGAGHATASSMGHLPIGGDEGSARRLAALGLSRTVYVHLNNTNPVLDERSAERGYLTDLGIEVGEDGMEVEV